MIGIGNAVADDGSQLLDQAAADMLSAGQVLNGVNTNSLDISEQSNYFEQLSTDYQLESNVLTTETQQALLPADAQNSSLVVDADQQLLNAYDGLLTADQSAAADPSSAFGSPGDLTLSADGLTAISANLHVVFTNLEATLLSDFGLTDLLNAAGAASVGADVAGSAAADAIAGIDPASFLGF